MNWDSPNYMKEFYKRNTMLDTATRYFMHLFSELAKELDAEILAKKQFTYKNHTFTYYLN